MSWFWADLRMRRKQTGPGGGRAYTLLGHWGARVQQTCSANGAASHLVTRPVEKPNHTNPGEVKWHTNQLPDHHLTSISPAPRPSNPTPASPNPRKHSTHMHARLYPTIPPYSRTRNKPPANRQTTQNPSLAQTAAYPPLLPLPCTVWKILRPKSLAMYGTSRMVSPWGRRSQPRAP